MTHPVAPADPRIQDAAALLASYLEGGRESTATLRDVATILVDLRLSHTLTDGRADLGGRSPAYRAAVSEIYRLSGAARDDYDGIQSALRYHVSNLLHTRYGAEELAAVGMSDRSARERLAADRVAASELRDAFKDPALLAVRIAAMMEEVITPEALAAMKATRARAARQALEDVRTRADAAIAQVDRRLPRKPSKPA